MKAKKTPAPQRAGTATKALRERLASVLAALSADPAKLETWLRDGELRCRRTRNKVK